MNLGESVCVCVLLAANSSFVYRFHFSDGVGLPVARHLSVTLVPSLATTSVDVSESSIFGGTKLATKKKNIYERKNWRRVQRQT